MSIQQQQEKHSKGSLHRLESEQGIHSCGESDVHLILMMENMAAIEQSGWVKPQRAPTYEEIVSRINDLRTELSDLERQAEEMRETARLDALVKIRNIMRAQQLTVDDIAPDRRLRKARD
ncbi:hypothetical protein [Azohydromonas lata]|uniref:hypothetical protein n=1 Tax=Azohydromonas lata TaxID=45677 RepID=UPI0012F4AD32|nr:hypothetical protein [Azohydromonas lata]